MQPPGGIYKDERVQIAGDIGGGKKGQIGESQIHFREQRRQDFHQSLLRQNRRQDRQNIEEVIVILLLLVVHHDIIIVKEEMTVMSHLSAELVVQAPSRRMRWNRSTKRLKHAKKSLWIHQIISMNKLLQLPY